MWHLVQSVSQYKKNNSVILLSVKSDGDSSPPGIPPEYSQHSVTWQRYFFTRRITSWYEIPGNFPGRSTAKCLEDNDPKMLRYYHTQKEMVSYCGKSMGGWHSREKKPKSFGLECWTETFRQRCLALSLFHTENWSAAVDVNVECSPDEWLLTAP